MNDFRGGEVQNTVNELVRKFGMKCILDALLVNLKPLEVYNEDYINRLVLNLRQTLDDYEKRYDSKESL